MCSFKGKISQLTSTLPKGGLSDWSVCFGESVFVPDKSYFWYFTQWTRLESKIKLLQLLVRPKLTFCFRTCPLWQRQDCKCWCNKCKCSTLNNGKPSETKKKKKKKGLSEQFSFQWDLRVYRPDVASINSLSSSFWIERLCSVNFKVLYENFQIVYGQLCTRNVRYYKNHETPLNVSSNTDWSDHAHELSHQWELKPKSVVYEKRREMYASEPRMLLVSSLLLHCLSLFWESWQRSIFEKKIIITINTYLIPSKVCSNVTSPDTKYMVLRTSLMASELFAKHIGSLMIKGMASVDPSMVRKC